MTNQTDKTQWSSPGAIISFKRSSNRLTIVQDLYRKLFQTEFVKPDFASPIGVLRLFPFTAFCVAIAALVLVCPPCSQQMVWGHAAVREPAPVTCCTGPISCLRSPGHCPPTGPSTEQATVALATSKPSRLA